MLTKEQYMEAYRQRSLLTGLEVTYTQGSQSGEGLVLGVDEEARLLLRLPDGQERAFSAGEVQIKKDFLARLRQEDTPLPTGDQVAAMLDDAWAALEAGGYAPYYLYRQKFMSGALENVGWTRPGYVNQYNICMM